MKEGRFVRRTEDGENEVKPPASYLRTSNTALPALLIPFFIPTLLCPSDQELDNAPFGCHSYFFSLGTTVHRNHDVWGPEPNGCYNIIGDPGARKKPYRFRDIRVPLALLAVFLLPLLGWRRLRAKRPALLLVCLFLAASYLLWLKVFSIYRYLSVLELLAPVVLFGAAAKPIKWAPWLSYSKARRLVSPAAGSSTTRTRPL